MSEFDERDKALSDLLRLYERYKKLKDMVRVIVNSFFEEYEKLDAEMQTVVKEIVRLHGELNLEELSSEEICRLIKELYERKLIDY